MTVFCLYRAIDYNIIAFIYSGISHRRSADTHEKSSVGLLNKQLIQIQALLCMIFGRTGKPTLNCCWCSPDVYR